MAIKNQSTLNLRQPHIYQPTSAVVSWQSKIPVAPHSGTGSLNATQLSAASVPTRTIRSGQSKIPGN